MLDLYNSLLKKFGPQGWWPIVNLQTGKCEYHLNAPRNNNDVFEICVGAILTQNTNWDPNVVRSIYNLKKSQVLTPKKIIDLDIELLKKLIRPSGYYNQKAKKLKIFSKSFDTWEQKIPTREELLELWGIGPETADSILLYAYNRPEFVIDVYTKRMLLRMNLISKDATYEGVKELFQKHLPRDAKLFQEFHALIVEDGKQIT